MYRSCVDMKLLWVSWFVLLAISFCWGAEKTLPASPTDVAVSYYINQAEVSTADMSLRLAVYFRLYWTDKRLRFQPADHDGALKRKLSLDEIRNDMWMPDVFFANELGGQSLSAPMTSYNTHGMVTQAGEVFLVRRLDVKLQCHMKLQKYPMDTQMCQLRVESFSYKKSELNLKWKENPVSIATTIRVPAFTLQEVIKYDCSTNYTTGAFTCLEARLVLSRDAGFVYVETYLPGVLVVLLSWTAFSVAMDAGLQVALLSLLTLVQTAVVVRARSGLPRVSYALAIDVFTGLCLVFTLVPLLVLVVVCLLRQHRSDKSDDDDDPRLSKALRVSRVVGPVVFVFVFVIYVIIYAL